MSARQKLNNAHVNGVLIAAAVVGAVTGSWAVFLITAIIGVAMALHSGGIRLRSGRDRRS
ncbi:hypothetical protein [Planctomyces sp. SH-PL14]|uniref:hypothetical protein n=1 Tax=Planctomyces sp. SH-PL14 TaxID=1632864 RepID=UPI0009467543|nr:hypothetical protein [Planctomyces sp. SH-PL14]